MPSAIPSIGPLYHRVATAALFTSDNPTLGLNEFGFESDTGKYKIGNGATAWASLSYATAGTISGAVAATTLSASGLSSLHALLTVGDITAVGDIGATGSVVAVGAFACNGSYGQLRMAGSAAVDATGSALASYGFTQAQADAIVTQLNIATAALRANGILGA